jgi:hypothetical protein
MGYCVIDDVQSLENIMEHLPETGGTIILTTNATTFEGKKLHFHVDSIREEAVKYVNTY